MAIHRGVNAKEVIHYAISNQPNATSNETKGKDINQRLQ